MGVLTKEECAARQTVMFNHYVGQVEIEALCMVDMINQHIIPSLKAAGVGPVAELAAAVKTLQSALSDIHHEEDARKRADKARTLRLETMISIRETSDAAEAICPAALWTLATYKELQFLDQHVE